MMERFSQVSRELLEAGVSAGDLGIHLLSLIRSGSLGWPHRVLSEHFASGKPTVFFPFRLPRFCLCLDESAAAGVRGVPHVEKLTRGSRRFVRS